MDEMIYIVAGLFIISIIIEVVLSSMKKKTANRLLVLLMHKDYDAFDRMINEKKTKFFVPVFNSLMLQLHKSIIVNDKDEITSIIDKLEHTKMNKNQLIFFYSKVFSYFITENDYAQIEKYYQLISACEESPAKKYADMVYDTLVKHGYTYMEDAKLMLEKANQEDQRNIRILIGNMYENMGDIDHAKEYYHFASDN